MAEKRQNGLSGENKPSSEDAARDPAFAIAGIGASAGGLAALETLFSSVPDDLGAQMAFVVVQHLPPDYKNMLAELLGRCTALPVLEAGNGMAVAPGTVYVAPARLDLTIRQRRLWLKEPATSTRYRFPIDGFLRSLATDQRERSICIILSGGGSDGTQGLKAIKGEGGLAIVQNPDTAEFTSMPESAIATDLADFVLPPNEMPVQLAAYVHNVSQGLLLPVEPSSPVSAGSLPDILSLLHAKTGHDFSGYKQSTTLRRIEKRRALNGIGDLDDYLRFLQTNPAEVQALFREFMVGVTSFFRDPRAFEALRENAVLRLLAGKRSGDSLRIWVAGCSTGEEAYSMAILLTECMDELNLRLRVQIYATDIDNRAIEQGRRGRYPSSMAGDVSPERLKRFFTQDRDALEFRVVKSIREMIVFADHDVTKDPPFSGMDLISCRNILIYMGGELQKLVLGLFSYALVPGGFLFLGTSETVGDAECFAAVDPKWRLYQAKQGGKSHLARRLVPRIMTRTPRALPVGDSERNEIIGELVAGALLREHTPACAVINKRGDIVYIHGRTGKYLEPASGAMSLNIVNMAREGLKNDLIGAIHTAATQGTPVSCRGQRVKGNGDTTTIDLTVRPFPEGHPDSQDMLIVIFEEVRIPQVDHRAGEATSAVAEVAATAELAAQHRVDALERELQTQDEYLHSVIEELESANEELQSTIEEYHSTSEELETSREELQSVNEELMTVNAELQMKNADLTRTSNDMNNMLYGTGMGIVFVDLGLRIVRFTPNATRIVNLVESDVGRPVGHITTTLITYDRLEEDLKDVLETLAPKEVEVITKSQEWYRLRIIPYRTLDNVIAGAVIAFVSITEIKKLQSLSRLAVVVRDSYDAITVQSLSGQILAWNPGAEKLYGWTEAEALDMNMRELVPEGRRGEVLQMVRKLAEGDKLEPFLTERLTRDQKTMKVWMTASIMMDESGVPYAIATTERPDKSSAAEEGEMRK